MPGSTEAQQKRAVVRTALMFVLLRGVFAIVCACLSVLADLPGWGRALLGLLAALSLIPSPFTIVVVKERFREIEGGEQNAADQY